jgi:hypothetical protein
LAKKKKKKKKKPYTIKFSTRAILLSASYCVRIKLSWYTPVQELAEDLCLIV